MGTPILNLHQYDNAQDFDYNDVNADYSQIDTLPPTVCTSGTRPTSNLYTNRMIWETDTSRLMMWTGTAWTNISDQGAWLDFPTAPKLYTTMGTTPAVISSTLLRAKYKIIGKTVFAQAEVTANAITASGCGIDLPFTAKDRLINCGTLGIYGSGTLPTDQSGQAFMHTDKARLIVNSYTTGYRDVGASGQTVRYNVNYELP